MFKFEFNIYIYQKTYCYIKEEEKIYIKENTGWILSPSLTLSLVFGQKQKIERERERERERVLRDFFLNSPRKKERVCVCAQSENHRI